MGFSHEETELFYERNVMRIDAKTFGFYFIFGEYFGENCQENTRENCEESSRESYCSF